MLATAGNCTDLGLSQVTDSRAIVEGAEGFLLFASTRHLDLSEGTDISGATAAALALIISTACKQLVLSSQYQRMVATTSHFRHSMSL